MKEHSGEESQEQRMRRHGMVLTWLISQRQQTARAPEVSRANITSCHLAFCHCKATVSSSWETLVASFRASWFPLTWWWTSPLQENKINWENDSLLNIAVKLWCFLGIIFCYLRLPSWLVQFQNYCSWAVHGSHLFLLVDSSANIVHRIYTLSFFGSLRK